MSALPFRNNLVQALHGDEVSLGGDGQMNQQDYDEGQIGEDFSTSANTRAVKNSALVRRKIDSSQVSRSYQPA